MSKILVLGASGGGKSTSLGNIPELNIEGLNPAETFIIACSNKGLPFSGWLAQYPRAQVRIDDATKRIVDVSPTGNYYYTNDGFSVANLILKINENRADIKNIVIDDSNYIMQDYYMANAKKGGYDVFKNIGSFMGAIFNAIETVDAIEKNVIMLAHYEEFRSKNADAISFRYKTVGKMVQDYTTPEGKFEIVLFTAQVYDEQTKKVSKHFVTNYDGEYPAKSPVGMFNEILIPNDLGYVLKKVYDYNHGVTAPQTEITN